MAETMEMQEDIANELRQAQLALSEGNIGKARVCARRAVGIAYRLSKHSGLNQISANECLKRIVNISEFPLEVRNAARRLAASVREGTVSDKPVEDALTIIKELIGS
jgi:ABC-type lipopolysaccharide export system ATPase subunit